jgi:hypothetical protein
MAEPAHRAATYEDLLAVPEHLVAEILFGRLVTRRRLPARCSATANALSAVLASPFQFAEGGPGGWILWKPEVHVGPHVVVPDIAAWRRQRLRIPPDSGWIDTAPAWACEVTSSAAEDCGRAARRAALAKAGVEHFWRADPVLRMLEVFELRKGKWLSLDVFRRDEQVAAPPFAEASFSLSLLWPFDPQPTAQA